MPTSSDAISDIAANLRVAMGVLIPPMVGWQKLRLDNPLGHVIAGLSARSVEADALEKSRPGAEVKDLELGENSQLSWVGTMHTKVNFEVNAKQVELVLRRQLIGRQRHACLLAKPRKRYWLKE